MAAYQRTGYLNEHFRIFHLTDSGMKDVDFHYHEFHKILIFLRGNISYCIEGRTYDLTENDIVFVHAGEVHRPILHDSSPYERIIVYISREFLAAYSDEGNDLELCLKRAHENFSHVLRAGAFYSTRLGNVVQELERSFLHQEYADELYHRVLFLEFMIQLNRAALKGGIEYISNSTSNPKILSILDYINSHLTEELGIDDLADTFFLSRYHLMHVFKEQTGYTIGHYLTTKRLLLARELIEGGTPVTDACYSSGFRNYSTFFRAYKKSFGVPPTRQLSAESQSMGLP